MTVLLVSIWSALALLVLFTKAIPARYVEPLIWALIVVAGLFGFHTAYLS